MPTSPGRPPPPGGGGGSSGESPPPSVSNDKLQSVEQSNSYLPRTARWGSLGNAVKTVSNRIRTFEEILADETKVRNILEINLKKIIPIDQPLSKPANLTHEQLGELIFDKLKIKHEDCLRFNFTSARYDTREISLRPGVDLSPFVTTIENFYGHTITTRTQSSNIVKVTFKQVPLNVPDEEIIHLCKFYGNPLDNKVHYETLSNSKFAGISGATRFVEMEMTPGKSLLNFYWMEGPLPGDQGCRVTVLHPGQDRQCGHCLQTKMEGCPGQGQAKVCKELGTKMTRMIDYMSKVKELTGYESLKTSYARKFPSLGSKNTLVSNMTENSDADEEVNQDNPHQTENVDNHANFLSEELSKNQTLIDDLRKQLTEKEGEVRILSEKVNPSDEGKMETLEKEVSEKTRLYNELQQQHAQLKHSSGLSQSKLCTTRQALDNLLSENITDPQFNEFHNLFKFIVAQYSSLLSSPDHYFINPDKNEVTIHTELFENVNEKSDPTISKNLAHFKEQLKIKLELDCTKRLERRNSVGRGRASSIPGLCKKRQLEIKSPDVNAKRAPSNNSRK